MELQGGKYYFPEFENIQKEITRALSKVWSLKLKQMYYYEPDKIQIILVHNPNIQN